MPDSPGSTDRPAEPAGVGRIVQAPSRPLYPDLIVCRDCDTVVRRPQALPGHKASCPNCGATLLRGHAVSLSGQLALTITALLCFVLANAFPIVELEVAGRVHGSTLLQAGWQLWVDGSGPVALFALACAFVFPLAELLLRLAALLAVLLPSGSRDAVSWLRRLRGVQAWSMSEVYLIGMLVTVFKIGSSARVILDVGLFSLAATTVLIGALRACGEHALIDAGGLLPAGDRSAPPAPAHRAAAAPQALRR